MYAFVLLLTLATSTNVSEGDKTCVQSFWKSSTSQSAKKFDADNDKNKDGLSLSCIGFVEPSRANAALDSLKTALRGDTKEFFSRYVEYPLVVNSGPHSHHRYSKHYLEGHFGDVFNVETRKLVQAAQVRDFQISDHGVYLGSGVVWWHVVPDSGEIQLSSVNVISAH